MNNKFWSYLKSPNFFYASLTFFLIYRSFLGFLIIHQRILPPINDNYFYSWRINLIQKGVFHKDPSFLFTYPISFLGKLLGLGGSDLILYSYIGGVFIVGLLLFKIAKLYMPDNFSRGLLLILFSLNTFGPRSFLQFLPSTLTVLLSLILWGILINSRQEEDSKNFILKILVLSLIMTFFHSSGFPVACLLLLSSCLFYRKKEKFKEHLFKIFPVILISGIFLYTFNYHIDFDTPPPPLKPSVEELNSPEARTFNALLDFGKKKGWQPEVYGNLFIYFWPNSYVGLLILLFNIFLIFDCKKFLLKPHFLKILFPLGLFLSLFLLVTVFHRRGGRLAEFIIPLLIILYALLLYHLMKKRRYFLYLIPIIPLPFILLNTRIALSHTSDSFNLTHLDKNLTRDGIIFFPGQLELSYLLMEGETQIMNINFLPYLKNTKTPLYLFQLKNCFKQTNYFLSPPPKSTFYSMPLETSFFKRSIRSLTIKENSCFRIKRLFFKDYKKIN